MRTQGNQRGLVIITVLWTVVILTVMVAILGRKSRLDMKVSAARMEAVRCKWASRAGIEKAMAVLKDDETENDSLIDTWHDNDEDFNDVLLERCWFTVRVIDEASKLNVNTATRDQLLGLPNMVEEIADAIIDWRDTDDVPGMMGIEGGYYEGLTFGYSARNGPFKTLRELLLVKDVTEELFYGEDTNLNGQLDYNERDGDLSPPLDDGDDVLDVGWAAYLTCYSGSGGQNQGGQNQNQNQSGQNQNNQNQNNQSQSDQNQSSQSSQNQSNQNQNNRNQSNQSQSNQNQSGQSQSSQNQNSQNQSSQSQSNQSQSNQNQNSQNQGNQNQNQSQNSQSTSGQTYAAVNINTASDIVLTALLGGDDEAARNALAIIDYRDSLTEGIQSTSELVDQRILEQSVFDQISSYITTRSDIFTILCVATADRNGPNGATLVTEAVVDRSQTPCKVLYWYQGVNN